MAQEWMSITFLGAQMNCKKAKQVKCTQLDRWKIMKKAEMHPGHGWKDVGLIRSANNGHIEWEQGTK